MAETLMNQVKILIVEDEAIAALDLQSRLASLGYPIPDTAYSGEEALSKALQSPPDLILMDIMLPGKIDGVQTAEQILARFDIPIIYITAYTDESTVERAKQTQPYGYIVKPFNEREVRITVDMALYKHRMEAKLKDSEKMFRGIFDASPTGIALCDSHARPILVNGAALQIPGLADMPRDTSLFDDPNMPVELIDKLKSGQTIRFQLPYDFEKAKSLKLYETNKSGSIWLDVQVTPLDTQQSPGGYLIMFQDISEIKKSERLKDDFIGMVSHELRTPLTVVMGAVLTALSEGLTIQEVHELLRDAAKSAESMAHLVDNLLELSRYQANRLTLTQEKMDVAHVVRDVIQQEKNHFNSHSVFLDIPKSLPMVCADRVKLEHMLRNLLDNAVKYSPDNTEIRVSAREEGRCVKIAVRDHGKGLEAEERERLFQPFERLSQTSVTSPGLGLGLLVCQRLAEAQGGKIGVDSEPEKGSTFWFTLPTAQQHC